MKLSLTRAVVTLALILPIQFTQASDKPNILIIWGDDIGQFNVSAYNMGMMGYRTPNIDRIAAEGLFLPIGTASRVVRLVELPL